MSTGPVRLRVARRIDADPTSTALLLAGPAALELWPGVRRVAQVAGRTLVETEVTDGDALDAARPGDGAAPVTARTTAATVVAEPPHRTPTAFVTRFSWTGPDLPPATGVLTLTYVPCRQGTPATAAELVLDVGAREPGGLDDDTLTALAEGFLVNLAQAAHDRRAA